MSMSERESQDSNVGAVAMNSTEENESFLVGRTYIMKWKSRGEPP
jgi:hypothetical protein